MCLSNVQMTFRSTHGPMKLKSSSTEHVELKEN